PPLVTHLTPPSPAAAARTTRASPQECPQDWASGRSRPGSFRRGSSPRRMAARARRDDKLAVGGGLGGGRCAHRKDTTMAARPEVVALLTDLDLQRTGSGQRLVHRNGTPFTPGESDLLTSATDEDLRAAASELAAAPERLAELFMPSLRPVAEQIADHPP